MRILGLSALLACLAACANATTTVKRSDFNAAKYAPHVGDEVTINIAIEAIKE